MPTLELTNLDNRLLLRPDMGASIVGLWLGDRPVLAPARLAEEPNPTHSSLFAMLPWCNRLSAGGVIGADGALHPVEPNWATTPYPVHGIGWLESWQVDHKSESSAQLSLAHEGSGIYAFQARYQISLIQDGVSFTTELTNAGDVTLPFGVGFHPYFPRYAKTKLSISGSSVTTFSAEGLPHRTDAIAADGDMSKLTHLDTRAFNHQVNGAGSIPIEQPDDAVSLAIKLSDELCHAHLWAPAGESFFCIEPLSHAVDAFSHAEQAQGHMLTPGRSMEATMRLIYLD